LLPDLEGQTRFDLGLANELALREAGVESIERAGLCTACHVDDWYSHRAENGCTGRFGALVALREG
jgi:copper oxidase (laccase) domain-containing protein